MTESGKSTNRTSPAACPLCRAPHIPGEPHVAPAAGGDGSLDASGTAAPVEVKPRLTGMFFEEFEVGQTFDTVSRTITERDVNDFAALTGDDNPLHLDEAFASTSRWGGRIAHGLCTLAMATGLFSRLGVIAGTAEAFLSMDTQFHDVVRLGDSIRVTTRVTRKRALPGQPAGVVAFEAHTYNQHGRLVQRGTWSAIIRRGPAPEMPVAP